MPVPPDLGVVRRILAVKLSSFGDVVHVTPCLRALRQTWPQAEIVVAVDRTWASALRHDPNVDGVIAADPRCRDALSSLLPARRLLAQRRGARFDLALDFQGLGRSAAWVYVSGARFRAGRGNRRPGWQRVAQPDPQQHAVRVCADIAALVGCDVGDLEPRLHCSPTADLELDELLRAAGAQPRGFVLANPFAAWKSKTWPLERWVQLLRRLRGELGVEVVVCGGPGEEADAARLRAAVGDAPPPCLVGRLSLEQALCLYRRAAIMVTGDTGPMHAAAALGTTVVALFGPTWPERTGPCGRGHRVLQVSRGDSPRIYRDAESRRHMEAIPVDMVCDAVLGVLERR